MRKTENYGLNILETEDFYSEEAANENTEKVDEILKQHENPEYDVQEQKEVEELTSGESLKVAFRKLARAVADYISHKADQVKHITEEERTAWNAKLSIKNIANNFTTEDSTMIAAAPLVKQLYEENQALEDVLDKRTIGRFVRAGESPASNVLDYAREYFKYGGDETTCYFLVRCSDKDGNSSLSAHKYVKWVSQNFFIISTDGIAINDVNKWGTIILDDDTGKTLTISTITEEMYLTLKKSNNTVEKISTNLNGLCIQKGIIYLNSGASGRIYFKEYKTEPTIILSCAVNSSKFYYDSVTVEQAMVYNNIGTTVGIEWIAIGIAK